MDNRDLGQSSFNTPGDQGGQDDKPLAREDYDRRVERKYLPRRVAPAWFVGVGALALAGGFSLLSFTRTQNVDLSAPPRLPRKIRPAPTPIPAPDALPTPSPREAAALQDVMLRADQWANESASSAQPSLIVCEPVASLASSTKSTSARAFGDGCARWLHLNAAGDPALGATPLWHRVEYARLSIADSRSLAGDQRQAFRVGASDIAALYRATGATRIAVGSLQTEGDSPSAPAVLAYDVRDVASGRSVATLSIRGTRAAITQQLPDLARRLRAAASTSTGAGEIPARCELSAGELETVGAAPWSIWNVGSRAEEVSDSQVRALEKLAPRSSLAALEMLHDYPYIFGDKRYDAAQNHLLRLAPRNSLAWAGAACLNADSMHDHQSELDALSRRFSTNAALCLAQCYLADSLSSPKDGFEWAQRAVRLAPRDPVAWRAAGRFADDQADALRQGRFANDISSSEWEALNRFYSMSLFYSARAISLDARDGRSWRQLCMASTFSGDSDASMAALWQGLAIDPANSDLCAWALEMLQPKWTRRTDLLPVIITHIERVQPLFENLHAPAIQALSNASALQSSFGDEANAMLTRTSTRLTDEARLQPKNPEPHLALALFAKKFGLRDTQLENCLHEFRTYLALCPWDASTHHALGWMLHHRTQKYQEAQSEYETALRIKPDFLEARTDLVDLIKLKRSAPSSAPQV